MTRGGLLVAGVVVQVDGVDVANPLDTSWARLGPGDYRKRRTTWTRQAILHTTKGIWPQHVIPGALPGGKDKLLADFYRKDPNHNGAHAAADLDGTGACLADLARDAAFHATTSNDWSWGLEIYQLADGGLTEASIAAAREMVIAGCEALGIPLQIHYAPYRSGQIVERMRNGGPDCVGIFGHRDQAWDFRAGRAARGRGDPGDIVVVELANDPRVERFDFTKGEDLDAWERRQRKLNAMGQRQMMGTVVEVDGIAGPATMRALRSFGCSSGRELDAVVEMPTG